MMNSDRSFAIVTGASSGIGLELAKQCAQNGFDLLIAADEAEINQAAEQLRALGAAVDAVEADLATTQGVDRLYDAIGGRKVGSPCSPMPAVGLVVDFSIRILEKPGGSWTRTLPARST